MIKKADTLYVNKIMKGGYTINKIYNNGDIYWGNYVPPFTGIRGTASVVSTTVSNALYYNNAYHNILVDANGNWEITLSEPLSSIGTNFIRNNVIVSIDFRNAVWSSTADLGGFCDTFNATALRDVYFDFSNIDTSAFICGSSIFRYCPPACQIHGFGTLRWTALPAHVSTNNFSLREFASKGFGENGTLDIRGYNTINITDDSPSNWGTYPPSATYGFWYNFPQNCRCTTWIIGGLEIQYSGINTANYVTTLYCTTQTPPSLDRTGANGMSAINYLSKMPNLQNIYVPIGCISTYQNASGWSDKASIISEREAPDPLTI